MATLLSLSAALRRRGAPRNDVQHVRIRPRICNSVEVGEPGLTWLEIIVATLAVIGWAFLCVVTL